MLYYFYDIKVQNETAFAAIGKRNKRKGEQRNVKKKNGTWMSIILTALLLTFGMSSALGGYAYSQ